MKKNLLALGLLTAIGFGSSFAQSKINGHGIIMLDSFKTEATAAKSRGVKADVPTITAIVTMNEGFTADALKEAGYEVSSVIADMAFVVAPLPAMEDIAAMDAVKAVEFGTRQFVQMDKGRELANVDAAHTASTEGLEGHAFTGNGVTVGLYDTGLDPNHAAFRNADGSSRVKAIYVQRLQGSNQEITDPEQISLFTTEEANESHGTHVLGIMAGSNIVTGQYAKSGVSGVQTGTIPYYGVAPSADIIVGCGDFYDSCILSGVQKVVEKGVALGQPTVVNLSLGGNTGSHDPNSSTSRILDALGAKAIICISAGNEGDQNMALTHRFSSIGSNKVLKTFMVSNESPSTPIYFTAEFWCDSEEEFTSDIVLFDKTSGSIVDKVTVGNKNGMSQTWSSNESSAISEQYNSSTNLKIVTNVDRQTNRYYLLITGTISPKSTPTQVFGVNLTGKSGSTVYGYINSNLDNAVFSSENQSGYKNGTPNGSINGFGCGYNMVSVGAYTSRSSAPYVGGGNYAGMGTIGDIAYFSSYGKTGDGRQLPHVCAPGAQIVSSVSSYWAQNVSGMLPDRVNALSDMHQRTSPYYPMQGTSMASPFVAGCVALWLEAFPAMTITDCHEIIQQSSITDKYTNNSTGDNLFRWGAGKIDALAGLKLAIKRNASLHEVLADPSDKNLIIENLGNGSYQVSFVDAQNIDVTVYSLQGAAVAAASANSDTVTLDASALQPGVYVVSVATPNGPVSRKLALR